MPLSAPDILGRTGSVADSVAAPVPDVRSVPLEGTRVGTLALAGTIGIAAILAVAWGGPMMGRMVHDGDFPFHIAAAEHFAQNGTVTMPHFLLQVLLGIVLATGAFASTATAAVVFFCGLYAAAGAAVCWFVARGGGSKGALAASVALTLAVLMAAPILPRGEPELFLIGYFPPNVYHNPTMLMAKPLLVFAFVCVLAALTRVGTLGALEAWSLAIPVVLLGLAKPNYLGCIVPVLVAGGAWSRLRGRAVSWARIAVVCIAAVATLASTYLLYESRDLGGVVFAPFQVIAVYAPVDALSIVRGLAGSLAFPLAVTLMWPRAAAADLTMRAAWGGTLVALFFSYFLAEGGVRLDHGNFLWTGQMGVFVLFLAAAAFVRRHLHLSSPSAVMFGRMLAIGVILLFHVESGLRHAGLKMDVGQWLAFWM